MQLAASQCSWIGLLDCSLGQLASGIQVMLPRSCVASRARNLPSRGFTRLILPENILSQALCIVGLHPRGGCMVKRTRLANIWSNPCFLFGHECRNCRILPQPAKGPFGWAPQASPRRPRLKGAFEGGGRCNQGARFRCQVWLCFVQHETCFVHAGFIWAGPRGADKRWHPTYLHSVRTSRYARCAQLSISQEA